MSGLLIALWIPGATALSLAEMPVAPATLLEADNRRVIEARTPRILTVANKRSRPDLKLLFKYAEDRVHDPKIQKPAQKWVEHARRLPLNQRTGADNLALVIHAWSQGNLEKVSEYAYAGLKGQSANERITAYLLIYLGIAFEKRDPKMARYNYLQSTQVDPTLYRGHFELARTHFLRNEYSKAEAELKKALTKNPNHWVVYEGLGKLYLETRRYAKAASFFEMALMKDSSAYWIWVELGDVYFHRLNRKEKGGAMYKEALVRNDAYAEGHWKLGTYYEYRKDADRAEREWLKAVQLDPGHTAYRLSLGTLYRQLNKTSKALEQLRAILKREPENIPTRLQLAIIFENLKQYHAARNEYARVLKSDPKNPQALKRLQQVDAALEPPKEKEPPTPRKTEEPEQLAQSKIQNDPPVKVAPVPDPPSSKVEIPSAPPKPAPANAAPPSTPPSPKPGLTEPIPKRKMPRAQDMANFPSAMKNELRIPLGSGWSPLHYAAALGDVKKVRALLERGFPVDAKNEFARTPLYVAAKRGELEAVALLIQSGADVNAREGRGGYFPLHIAAGFGQTEVVQYLLQHGAVVDARTFYGDTPLMEVTYNAWHKDSSILKLLHQWGASLTASNKEGCQALCYASQRGNLIALEFLLQHKAPVDIKNNEGATPLFLAVMSNHLQVVRQLLKFEANPQIPSRGVTPLELAKMKKYLEIYVLLLSKANSQNPQPVAH